MKTSIKSLATVALLSVLALIAGCGGGGAKDPFATTPVPALVVNPTALNVYPGVPAVLTISSGVGPFQVFSSDSAVLPVTQVVSGAAITLTANQIDGSDRAVTITVRDAAGQSTGVTATVKPSPTLTGFDITSVSNTQCPGFDGNTGQGSNSADISPRTSICTGETAAAQVLIRTSNTTPVQGRQIRYDVVQGAYNFVLDANGTTLAKSHTVLSDQNGRAITTIKADPGVGTQIALIRVTDVATGNRVDTWFTIVQSINGSAIMSVVPPTWEVQGYFANECSGAAVDYLVYGGTPPYTVRNDAPNFVGLLAEGVSSPTQVVVSRAGGRFTAIAGYSAACAADIVATFVITDATGRNTSATYKAKPGTVARQATQIAPTAVTVRATAAAPGGYCAGSYNFVAASEFAPISWNLSVPSNVATLLQSGTSVVVTLIPSQVKVGDVVTVIAVDSNSKIVTATITCAAPT